MIDSDLADLDGAETKCLNQQASRNIERFPSDFMFVLSVKEESDLRLQIATANNGVPSKKSRVSVIGGLMEDFAFFVDQGDS